MENTALYFSRGKFAIGCQVYDACNVGKKTHLRRTRHQFDGGGFGLRSHHGIDVLCVILAVFGSVGDVDLGIDLGISFLDEGDVFVDTACQDVTFMTY
jgi:hypothetical protein